MYNPKGGCIAKPKVGEAYLGLGNEECANTNGVAAISRRPSRKLKADLI